MNDPGANHGLTAENILATFPIALQDDVSAAALGEITARLLARRPEEIDRLRIYPVIDQLPERLLDILAHDFKVDWWDPDYTLWEKRRTLKDSWRVHKMLGTKAAVETAIRAIYPKTEVQEWFEYGGEPYHFRLNIDLTDTFGDETRPWRVLERVNFYKSLRSHNDEIHFTMTAPAFSLHVGGGMGANPVIGIPEGTDRFSTASDALHMGGAFGANATVSIPEEAVRFSAAEDTLHTRYTAGLHSSRPVPEDTAQPPATTVLRTGGVCTIISNLSGGN